MSEHQQVNRQVTGHDADEAVVDLGSGQQQARADQGFDDLLDEIDGLLEGNAQEYVRSFVQKGGE